MLILYIQNFVRKLEILKDSKYFSVQNNTCIRLVSNLQFKFRSYLVPVLEKTEDLLEDLTKNLQLKIQ